MLIYSGFIYSGTLDSDYALTNTPTNDISLPNINYEINNHVIFFSFEKRLEDSKYVTDDGLINPERDIIDVFSKTTEVLKKIDTISGIPSIGQNVKSYFCINSREEVVSILIFSHREYSKSLGVYINYIPRVYLYKNNMMKNISGKYDSDGYFDKYNAITTEDGRLVYFYSNKKNILKKSFDVGLCDKGKTIKSKIKNNRDPDSLKHIELQIKHGGKLHWSILSVMNKHPLSKKNVVLYNNIAFYLINSHDYINAAFILKNIIFIYPLRIVANLNLADCYWALGNKKYAHRYYRKYVYIMRKKGKVSKIPERALKRVGDNNIQ